jgi:hypothetical protein
MAEPADNSSVKPTDTSHSHEESRAFQIQLLNLNVQIEKAVERSCEPDAEKALMILRAFRPSGTAN